MIFGVKDANGVLARITSGVSFEVKPPPTWNASVPSLGSIPFGLIVGVAVNIPPFPVINGVPPYRYEIFESALPPGLTYGSNGVLSGTPYLEGLYGINIDVIDSNGVRDVSMRYNISVRL